MNLESRPDTGDLPAENLQERHSLPRQGYNFLEDLKNPIRYFVQNSLWGLKFAYNEANEDLKGRMSSEQIRQYLGGDRIFSKLRDNAVAMGCQRDQAGKYVGEKLFDLFVSAEGTIGWKRHPLLSGLGAEDVGKLHAGFSKYMEAINREREYSDQARRNIKGEIPDGVIDLCSGDIEYEAVQRDDAIHLSQVRKEINENKEAA